MLGDHPPFSHMADDLNIRFNNPRDASGRFVRIMDPLKAGLIDQLHRDAVRDILDFAEDQAKMNAPARTGNLKRSIGRSDVSKTGSVYSGELTIGALYGKWVESGTGVHGPFGTVIRPRVGNVMVWREFNPMVRPGQETKVFAAWTRGQVGQHFVRRAYEAAEKIYTPARLAVLQSQIKTLIEDL